MLFKYRSVEPTQIFRQKLMKMRQLKENN